MRQFMIDEVLKGDKEKLEKARKEQRARSKLEGKAKVAKAEDGKEEENIEVISEES